jgi:hypothetical protein
MIRAMFDCKASRPGDGRNSTIIVTLLGGPFDGATVPWDAANLDVAFPYAETYAWYRLSAHRRCAVYWPLISQRGEDPRESDAA